MLLLTKKFEENARGEFGYGIYYQNLSIEALDTVKSHSLLICINTLSLEKSNLPFHITLSLFGTLIIYFDSEIIRKVLLS